MYDAPTDVLWKNQGRAGNRALILRIARDRERGTAGGNILGTLDGQGVPMKVSNLGRGR